MFNFNEAELGNVLLTLPLSSLAGLPIAGWLLSRFESRFPLFVSMILSSIALSLVGFVNTTFSLIPAISLFAFCLLIQGIAMNTQAVYLQKKTKQKIIGSFHGIWSIGGIVGIIFSTLVIKIEVSIQKHLLFVSLFSIISAISVFKHLLRHDIVTKNNSSFFGKPDLLILLLGLMAFFASVCEGGMYDWSGVYFKDVIKEDLFTWGYLSFMVSMALSRFFSDYLIGVVGMEKAYVVSAILISVGIFTAIAFPFFWMSIIGFSLVGFGAAAIIPMTFSLADRSNKYSPGVVISIISTYGMFGMFAGPPLIGYLAHAFDLQTSFIVFIISGLMLIPLSKLLFKYLKKIPQNTI